MENQKQPGLDHDGVDRRGMLKCMAWVGTGVLWTVSGGIPVGRVFGREPTQARMRDFSFVQISDSHIGFGKEPNRGVVGTLQAVVAKINAQQPAFVLHTGDLTHLAKPEEFDTVAEVLKGVKAKVLYVPGEHDFDNDDNKLYLDRFGKGAKGTGWYSFDYQGAHFVGLVNVANAKSGSPMSGLGQLGAEQLDWLRNDLSGLADSTPLLVFAHVPLWMVYEKWGWGTKDGGQALALLRRFGSVTVLNGHIHQVMQRSRATSPSTPPVLPLSRKQPGKGTPAGSGSAADRLRSVLGPSAYVEHKSSLASRCNDQ